MKAHETPPQKKGADSRDKRKRQRRFSRVAKKRSSEFFSQRKSHSCLVETKLAKWWHRRRRIELRPCCVCGVGVGNKNLAGYDGRSALTGPLYCPRCADHPSQPFQVATR